MPPFRWPFGGRGGETPSSKQKSAPSTSTEIESKKSELAPPREQKQIPIWDKLTFDEKQSFLLNPNCPTFKEWRHKATDLSLKEKGEILSMARDLKILSPEIDSWIISIIRTQMYYSDSKLATKISYEEPFISQLEKFAENEPEEIEEILKKYSEIVSQARQIAKKQKQKQPISDEERKTYEECQNLQSSISKSSYKSPAKLILHFYRNGDLKWIWGITEQDTRLQVGDKNDGFRIADGQDADW